MMLDKKQQGWRSERICMQMGTTGKSSQKHSQWSAFDLCQAAGYYDAGEKKERKRRMTGCGIWKCFHKWTRNVLPKMNEMYFCYCNFKMQRNHNDFFLRNEWKV
jgi:hypothetical protein